MSNNTSFPKKITFNEIIEWQIIEDEGLYLPPEIAVFLKEEKAELFKGTDAAFRRLGETIDRAFERYLTYRDKTIRDREKALFQFLQFGDSTPLIKYAAHDLRRFKARTPDGKITEKFPLMEERRRLLEFWRRALKTVELWRDQPAFNQLELEKLRGKVTMVIREYQIDLNRPGPKDKAKSDKPKIVSGYLHESLANFIKKSFPHLIMLEGEIKGQRFYNIDFNSADFNPMLTAFLKEHNGYFLSAKNIENVKRSIGCLPRLKPRTIRTIAEKIVCEKYNLSEASFKRASRRNS